MRVALVTGSREWTDTQAVFDALTAYRPDVVIATGADVGVCRFATEWAHESETDCKRIPGNLVVTYCFGRRDAGDEVTCFVFGEWRGAEVCERNRIEVRRHG